MNGFNDLLNNICNNREISILNTTNLMKCLKILDRTLIGGA